MDVNSSGLETSGQLITLGDDFAETKSFRCTFCKRGFSNAQALGGHMNIHRKDRAKLREFCDENLLSLEISNSLLPRDPSLEEKLSLEIDPRHDDGVQADQSLSGVRRQQLFTEAPPSRNGEESRKVDAELDLELRLGPQPDHHAKSKQP